MSYKFKKNIILLFFASFVFIVLVYLFCPMGPFRRGVILIYSIEPLSNDSEIDNKYERTILLLGDSILANENYVPKGKTVFDFLKRKIENENANERERTKVKMFARDNYLINDVNLQITSLPISYNSKQNSIVLSVGGNNFLTGTSYNTATKEYLFLIEKIKETFPDCKLYLVNLYRPFAIEFRVYNKIISDWNDFLKGIVENGNADGIVDISRVITEKDDLVYKIEPSVIGSEKIAGAIVDVVSG